MTPEWQTVFLIIKVFVTYILMNLVIPGIVFEPVLKRFSTPLRLMGYLCIGNVWIVNLVFVLQFLRISNFFTLVLGTFLFYNYVFLHLRHIGVRKELEQIYITMQRFSTGVLKWKTFIREVRQNTRPARRQIREKAKEILLYHALEWLLLLVLVSYCIYLFGSVNLREMSYHASDVPVHTSWINAFYFNQPFRMGDRNGIYPQGFHVIIYYFAEVFRFPVMDLMRVYGLINITFLILTIAGFLFVLCRNPFLPMLGAFLFIGFAPLGMLGFIRYCAALPQEYGFIFLFPSCAFAVEFFRIRRLKELGGEKYQRFLDGHKTETETAADDPADREAGENDADDAASANARAGIFLADYVDIKERPPEIKEETPEAPEKKRSFLSSLMFWKKAPAEEAAAEEKTASFPAAKSRREKREFDRLKRRIHKDRQKKEFDRLRSQIISEREKKRREELDERFWLEESEEQEAAQLEDHQKKEYKDGYRSRYEKQRQKLIKERKRKAEKNAGNKPGFTLPPALPKFNLASLAEIPKKIGAIFSHDHDHGSAIYHFFGKIYDVILDFCASFVWEQEKLIMLLFAFAFSMTIAGHFYVTVAAAYCYFGIAAGFLPRFIKPRYFLHILRGLVLGFFLAAWPMLFAFTQGVPLQGSLGWALGVMSSMNSDETEDDTTAAIERVGGDSAGTGSGADQGSSSGQADSKKTGKSSGDAPKKAAPKQPLPVRIIKKFKTAGQIITDRVDGIIHEDGSEFVIHPFLFFPMAICLAVGGIFCFWDAEYGFKLLSACFMLAFQLVMLSSSLLGIPAVLDKQRSWIFILPTLTIPFTAAADGVLSLCFCWARRLKIIHILPKTLALAVTLGAVSLVYQTGNLRQVLPASYTQTYVYQTNGAVYCTGKIIREENRVGNEGKNTESFTILSCTDELQETLMYGQHYEWITLLRKLEHFDVNGGVQEDFNINQDNPDDRKDPNIYIPTHRVYIYIEKRPLDYSAHYAGSGQMISEEGANHPVPASEGNNIYKGESRWIVMSKAMEWLKAIRKTYPESITKLYEDDDFICYRMTQGDVWYNLGVDYGYNNVEAPEETEEAKAQ